MRDPFAPDLNQVPRCHLTHLYIVRPNKMGSQMGKVAIEEQIRRPVVTQFIKISKICLARSDQENIHTATQQRANLLPLDLGIFFRRSQNQRPVARPENSTQRFCKLRKERMHQVRNNQPNGVSPSAGQPSSHHVGLVIQLLHSLQHPPPRRFADVRVPPQDLRNSNDGDAKIARNILQPDSHTCSSMNDPTS
jgi:hypothetical protein